MSHDDNHTKTLDELSKLGPTAVEILKQALTNVPPGAVQTATAKDILERLNIRGGPPAFT